MAVSEDVKKACAAIAFGVFIKSKATFYKFKR